MKLAHKATGALGAHMGQESQLNEKELLTGRQIRDHCSSLG